MNSMLQLQSKPKSNERRRGTIFAVSKFRVENEAREVKMRERDI